ncbi:ankyrin repeat domain-containing protein [Shewanella waksmanii]|uniref:ankyrin repeat domain-containing protein n=1 Tax=Shewanella waksmanii TaxID=213783 RepID=UPI00373622CC
MKKRFFFPFLLYFIVLPSSANEEAKLALTATELTDYFIAAARVGDTEVLSQYLEAGFPVNQVNHQSYTALMTAAYAGQYDAVKLLLDYDADACIQDKRGNTAIMGAVIKAELRITRLLYGQSCDSKLTNNAGMTLEQFARYWGQQHQLTDVTQ